MKINKPFIFIKKYKTYLEYKNKEITEDGYFFDLIISNGEACRPAYYLKQHFLRTEANPLDWMMSYSLETSLNLYKTEFRDFFKNYTEDKEKSAKGNYNWYSDDKNKIISIHYKEIGEDNIYFRQKMQDRFKKLNSNILSSNHICFISDRTDNYESFEYFLKNIATIYPMHITYINIKNNKNLTVDKSYKKEVKNISNKLTFIEFEFNDTHPINPNIESNPDAWIGNFIVWNKIMSKIDLNKKRNFIKYLIGEIRSN